MASHALFHRRKVGTIADQFSSLLVIAGRIGKCPYLTHSALASWRGVQHRNTSRVILRELFDLGLIRSWPFRPGRAIRFVVRWKNIFAYAQRYQVMAFAAREGVPTRTKAEWDAERARWRQEAEAKRKAAEAAEAQERKQRADKERQESKQLSPLQFALLKIARLNKIVDQAITKGIIDGSIVDSSQFLTT